MSLIGSGKNSNGMRPACGVRMCPRPISFCDVSIDRAGVLVDRALEISQTARKGRPTEIRPLMHRAGCEQSDHPRIGRRDLLQLGSLGLFGMSLADLLR